MSFSLSEGLQLLKSTFLIYIFIYLFKYIFFFTYLSIYLSTGTISLPLFLDYSQFSNFTPRLIFTK